jgi:hypothetical protein
MISSNRGSPDQLNPPGDVEGLGPVGSSGRENYSVTVLRCLHGVIDVLIFDAGSVKGCGAGR